ncbi:MAG: DUF4476 domain-containing protein [Bacteroidota bacterium]
MSPKIFTFFYLLFCVLTSRSQTNTLVVFSESGQPFNLSVNQETINKTAEANVKVFNLPIGWNLIEIKVPGLSSELNFKDSILLSGDSKFIGKEFTYALVEKEKKLFLKFKSVSEHSGPEQLSIPEAPKETIPLVDNSIYGNLYQAVKNNPVFFDNFNEDSSECKVSLTDKEIKYALNLMIKVNDKETAYRYTNLIIDNNCYKVSQLIELLNSVPIDMDKLNSAKKAYSHITDKQNINALMTIFRYPAMKESFTSFLKDQESIIKQKALQCKEPISNIKFESIFVKIKNTSYENEKINLAKKLMIDICLSTEQVKKLCELITHDREKMELLKSAYNVITDKVNASLLAEEFQFSETKEEFLKFIAQSK